MVDEFIMDAALQSHSEVARNRSMCNVCHTRCVVRHRFLHARAGAEPYPTRVVVHSVPDAGRVSAFGLSRRINSLTVLRSVHNFGSSNTTQNGVAGSSVESRVGTPAGEGKTTGAGANTPNNVKDGNVYLDCVNCGRQVCGLSLSSFRGRCSYTILGL